ncbi:MAG: cobamide remodeling phosphodiesterase CbiR [Anaerolineae bacterium]
MITLGTTTLPLAGWIANPQQPAESRAHRLRAMRRITEGYGMRAVELTLDLQAIYSQVFDAGFYESVAELQRELGFVCTVHLPFLWVEPASLNEAIRQASVDCLRQAVEITRAVDVRAYVLHLWGFSTGQVLSQLREPVQRQALLGALLAQANRSLSALCDIVEPEDLCVENLEDSLFDLALPIIEQHRVSICLDVGHLALQGGDALAFLGLHGDRIREIHLHDAKPARDHLALGQGQIDHAALLEKLAEVEYQGPVILEVNTKADLEQSLATLKAAL